MRRWGLVLLWLPSLAGASDVEVPFDFLRNQIVLHATINGQGPYNIALDTGTHATTIDIRLAKRLRLPLGETKRESTGAGRGRTLARQTVCRELRVGELTVRNLAAVALDMSKVSQLMGRPLHGVLGYGFLASRIVQIDYFRRRIRFCAQSAGRPENSAARSAARSSGTSCSSFPASKDCGSVRASTSSRLFRAPRPVPAPSP